MTRYEEIVSRAPRDTGGSISSLVDEPGTFRIYGTKDYSLWCVVDRDDWEWLSRWSWCYRRSQYGKLYIARSTGNRRRKVAGYSVVMPCRQRNIYLHRAIMEHRGVTPPTPEHKIVGHLNGNSLDCRFISNLAWQTYGENNTNQHGRVASGPRRLAA